MKRFPLKALFAGLIALYIHGACVNTISHPDKTQRQRWLNITLNEGVTTLALSQDQKVLWIGTQGGLIRRDLALNKSTKITAAQGLPSNQIQAMAVDKNDHLWIGTAAGVTVLRGITWDRALNSRLKSLLNSAALDVAQIHIDLQNQVWLVINNRLIRYQNGILKKIPLPDLKNIRKITADKDGTGYCLAETRLIIIRRGLQIKSLPLRTISLDIYVNPWGEVYLSDVWGLTLIKNDRQVLARYSSYFVSAREVIGFDYTPQGPIFLVRNGFYFFNGTHWYFYRIAFPGRLDEVKNGVYQPQYGLFLGTSRGVVHLKSRVLGRKTRRILAKMVNATNFRGSARLGDIEIEPEGGIYVGLTQMKIQPRDLQILELIFQKKTEVLEKREPVDLNYEKGSKPPLKILSSTQKQIQPEVTRIPVRLVNLSKKDLRGSSLWYIQIPPSLKKGGLEALPFTSSIFSLHRIDKKLLIGSARGAYILAGKTVRRFDKLKDHHRLGIFRIKGTLENLWVALFEKTLQKGLGVINYRKDKAFQLEQGNGLISNWVTDIFLEPQKAWLATDKGITLVDFTTKQLVSWTKKEGLYGCYIFEIIAGQPGDIWIASTCGLTRYRADRFQTYSTQAGLLSNRVQALLFDKAGRLWIGTDKGLNMFDGKRFKGFTTADGLAYPSVSRLRILNQRYIIAGGDNGDVSVLDLKTL